MASTINWGKVIEAVVPQVLQVIREHFAGQAPASDAEVIAKMHADADFYIAQGKVFLASLEDEPDAGPPPPDEPDPALGAPLPIDDPGPPEPPVD